MKDSPPSTFIKIYKEDTILNSKKLIEKLFSVVKHCPLCSSKLKEDNADDDKSSATGRHNPEYNQGAVSLGGVPNNA